MNLWAAMLARQPASAQRAIARAQRISLPRACPPDERLRRMRSAMCHRATVRETYLWLEADARQALQALRHRRNGIPAAELAAVYGPARPWSALAADPRPRSIAERLLLLGWLLPAGYAGPPRYLVPPEVRRWLPQPLEVRSTGRCQVTATPPALTVTATLLLWAAERPRALRRSGTLRRAELRRLGRRLPQLDLMALGQIAGFVLPLLCELGLAACHDAQLLTTPAGQRFLALPRDRQLDQLHATWIGSGTRDAWLTALLRDDRGIDWPLLRRRLCAWVGALPADQWVAAAPLYGQLAAAFGPLASAHTHGFRPVTRVPWRSRRAQAVWAAALHGPLRWLGLVRWSDAGDRLVARMSQRLPVADAAAWRYGDDGAIVVPGDALDGRVLAILPYARFAHAGGDGVTYRISRASLARAVAQGYPPDRLWSALEHAAGPLSAGWRAALDAPAVSAAFAADPVLAIAPVALADRLLRDRSVRRYVRQRLGAGLISVRREHVPALARLLARRQVMLHDAPQMPPPARSDRLAPGEVAALLVAAAYYRRCAPAGSPLLPDTLLDERLSALLTPSLRAATEDAIGQLGVPDAAAPSVLDRLRQALASATTITICYQGTGDAVARRRSVVPLALEQHAGRWYLRAVCRERQAERSFRVDRITALPVEHACAIPALAAV